MADPTRDACEGNGAVDLVLKEERAAGNPHKTSCKNKWCGDYNRSGWSSTQRDSSSPKVPKSTALFEIVAAHAERYGIENGIKAALKDFFFFSPRPRRVCFLLEISLIKRINSMIRQLGSNQARCKRGRPGYEAIMFNCIRRLSEECEDFETGIEYQLGKSIRLDIQYFTPKKEQESAVKPIRCDFDFPGNSGLRSKIRS